MRHDLRDTLIAPSAAAAAPDKRGTIRREPIVLYAAMNVMEAFAAVTRGCITHITTAAEAVRRSDDPEGIHQLRVGVRWLRAAVSIFGPALPQRRPGVLTKLQGLQRQLGAARDLDVLCEEMIASLPEKLRDRPGMREFADAVQGRRAACRRRARSALASKRCAQLLSRLGPAIDRYARQHARDPATQAAINEPIKVFAADVLRSRSRKAHKLGRHIHELGPKKLHKLRIRIKKLRYAAEFFSSLAPASRSQPYLRALKDLQQLLGTSHDAVVASGLIAAVKAEGGAEAEPAAKLVHEWVDKSLQRVCRKLPHAWRRFDKRKRPLKRARKRPGRHRPRLHRGWTSSLVTTAS